MQVEQKYALQYAVIAEHVAPTAALMTASSVSAHVEVSARCGDTLDSASSWRPDGPREPDDDDALVLSCLSSSSRNLRPGGALRTGFAISSVSDPGVLQNLRSAVQSIRTISPSENVTNSATSCCR